VRVQVEAHKVVVWGYFSSSLQPSRAISTAHRSMANNKRLADVTVPRFETSSFISLFPATCPSRPPIPPHGPPPSRAAEPLPSPRPSAVSSHAPALLLLPHPPLPVSVFPRLFLHCPRYARAGSTGVREHRLVAAAVVVVVAAAAAAEVEEKGYGGKPLPFRSQAQQAWLHGWQPPRWRPVPARRRAGGGKPHWRRHFVRVSGWAKLARWHRRRWCAVLAWRVAASAVQRWQRLEGAPWWRRRRRWQDLR